MKKRFTVIISLLALICFSGINTAEGKTSKSKKKTTRITKTTKKSSYNPDLDVPSKVTHGSFFGWEGFYQPSGIKDDLILFGFDPKSTSKVRMEGGDGYFTAKKTVYSNGITTVEVYSYDKTTLEVHIKFGNTAELDEFINDMKSNGWKYNDTYNGTKRYYWNVCGMYVRGLNVTLMYED